MNWASALRRAGNTTEPAAVRLEAVALGTVDWDRLVTVDFETYFDTEYTLKKLSTSEYVRDPRFKAQMCGIKIGRKATKVYGPAQIAAALKKINWKTHSLLCHNTLFDGFILSHHYGVIPARYYDTLSMARGLHSNEIGAGLDEVAQFYGRGSKIEGVLDQTKGVLNWPKELFARASEYCAQDVDLTFDIFKDMLVRYPAAELDLIHMTTRMFCAPTLRVDEPRAQAEYEREVGNREALLLSVVNPRDYDSKTTLKTGAERKLEGKERDMLIVKRTLGSNEALVTLLCATGLDENDIPRKVSPAWIKRSPADKEATLDDKWVYAFSKDDLEFVDLPSRVWELFPRLNPNDTAHVAEATAISERLQNLVDARLMVKSTTNITRAERLLDAGRGGLPLPVAYKYYGAHTGRWSGTNKMNLQNLTRGGELRLSILAAPGRQLAVADSGQIEARVNAWLWGQEDLLEAFRLGRDIYSEFAAEEVYFYPVTKANKIERHVGKTTILGLGFSMGAAKFQTTLAKGANGGPRVNFTLDQCYSIVNAYRRRFYKIANGWKICTQIIEDMAAGIPGEYKCLSWGKEDDTGFVLLPNGMKLKYPELRKARGEKGWDEWSYQAGRVRKKIYGGLLCENLIQSLARIVVATQMLAIDKKYPVVMTTHDECVTHPTTAQADKCFSWMTKCMSTAPSWCPDLPLTCEGGYASNYSK